MVPDAYQHEKYGERLSSVLTPSVEFQRCLCLTHSEGIVTLEKALGCKGSDSYAANVKLNIESIVGNLKNLQSKCPTHFGREYELLRTYKLIDFAFRPTSFGRRSSSGLLLPLAPASFGPRQ